MAPTPTPTIQDGAVILFSGRSLESRMIRALTWRPWYALTPEMPSHVGVICRIDPADLLSTLPHVADDARKRAWNAWPPAGWSRNHFLVEATTLSDLPCLIQGVPFRGVQVQDLNARLTSYDGRAWIMQPRKRFPDGRSVALTHSLLHRVGISYDKPGALAAGTTWLKTVPPFRWLTNDRTRYFCVEVVGEALAESGCLGKLEFNPGAHSPRSLAELLYDSGTYDVPVEVT